MPWTGDIELQAWGWEEMLENVAYIEVVEGPRKLNYRNTFAKAV